MRDLQVYIKIYDDLEQLEEAIESIPDGLEVHVVDGRYADFPGDTVRTPGAREFCDRLAGVHYHTPPDDRLPWGHDRYEAEPHLRHPVHEQAKFANYEALPQTAWVLHLDADERIDRLDLDLDALDPRTKYVPHIDSLADRGHFVPRLYQPRYWTFWIADVMYPREFWPRPTPAADLRALHHRSMTHQAINRELAYDAIRIRNVGDDRPPEYLKRRAEHLEAMGRVDRAQEYRELSLR